MKRTLRARARRLPENPFLTQFDQLIDDLIAGTLRRTRFEKWEIQIVLDGAAFSLHNARRILNEYRKAVHRQFADGATVPMRLSEFLLAKGLKPKA